jgi:uncharacterized protein
VQPVEEVIVNVRVLARGSRSGIQGVKDGRLQVKTTSPPVGGAANKDVIRQLADEFDVPPSRVLLHRGASQRLKTFRILRPGRMPWYANEVAGHQRRP